MRVAKAVNVYRSAGFYPITGLYIGGVLTAACVVQDWVDVRTASIIYATMALSALLFAALKELRAVHRLLEAQRIELTERIDQLGAALYEAGVASPPYKDKSPADPTPLPALPAIETPEPRPHLA